MAEMGRRNPNGRYSALNDLGDEPQLRRSSQGGWRWMWVWPVVAALAFGWAGWGWGGSGGWWWGHNRSQSARIEPPATSSTAETMANTTTDASGAKQNSKGGGAQILASESKAEYIGLHFKGSHIPVQKRVNSHVMWIGEQNPMLAVVEGGGTVAANNVSQGRKVNADGLIEQAPPANEAKQAWSLSDQDASQLEKQGAFIELSELTLSQNASEAR